MTFNAICGHCYKLYSSSAKMEQEMFSKKIFVIMALRPRCPWPRCPTKTTKSYNISGKF